jgi:hypothetical protein
MVKRKGKKSVARKVKRRIAAKKSASRKTKRGYDIHTGKADRPPGTGDAPVTSID